MTIDGFDFTIISNGRVDPDSPIDTTLMTDLRDNDNFLKLWMGKSFIAGAVADHDHDGLNSKKVTSDDLDGGIFAVPYTEAGRTQSASRVHATSGVGTTSASHTMVLPVSSVDYLVMGTFQLECVAEANNSDAGQANVKVDLKVNAVEKVFCFADGTDGDVTNQDNIERAQAGGAFLAIIQNGQALSIDVIIGGLDTPRTHISAGDATFTIESQQRL